MAPWALCIRKNKLVRFGLFAIVMRLMLESGVAFATEQVLTMLPFVDPAVTVGTDLHYTGEYCGECHRGAPIIKGKVRLRFGSDFTTACRCHGYTSGTYIHPVGMAPSPNKQERIPKEFRLLDGKIGCVTCHDIGLQCQENPAMKEKNPAFLRGAPYSSRTGICLRCHEQGKYRMFDPHNQQGTGGRIIEEKCLYCHVGVPDIKQGIYKTSGIHDRAVKLIGDLTVLCYRCHFKQSRLHPINAEHFLVPSPKVLLNMQDSERRLGVILPLDDGGKVSCPTCHNPHERGVIPAERAAAKGASEKYRLRVPGEGGRMCQACHKK